MQTIVVTAQVFFDLFVLCLSWPKDLSDSFYSCYTWTTVDKVARILYGLGIITKKQRSVLYKNERLQLIFSQSTSRFDPKSSTKPLFLHLDHAIDINRRRLLRDYRLSLTPGGKHYADSIAAKYAPIITRKMYFVEIERQNKNKPAFMKLAGEIYRQRVKEETEEDIRI